MARTATKKKTADTTIITLKVTLRGSKPPIWRRLQMPGAMTLADLHDAIQGAMGWHDSHLHAFAIGGEQFGDRSVVDDVSDENSVTLVELLLSSCILFTYTYDFGDDWEHSIAFEKARPAAEGEALPRCLAGKRAGPPEDCGGIWGYQHLLEVLADPAHPDYAEQREWIEEELEPEIFDIDRANLMLKSIFAPK